MFNDIRIKSLLLNYYYDLENRCSFTLSDEYCKEFIKYNNDNIDISKDEIFKPIKQYSNKYKKVLASEIENHPTLKDFLKFLFYIDEKNFVDFFTFFIYVCYTGHKIEIEIQTTVSFEKEVKIFSDFLGL
jgi:hypothetical protein